MIWSVNYSNYHHTTIRHNICVKQSSISVNGLF